MTRAVAVVAWAMCGVAHACGNAGDTIAKGSQYVVAYRTAPSPIPASAHFAIDFTVCPVGNAPAPRSVRVDASMPEHRHGMNYRTTVTAKGGGRYRAEGLLFHMSGRWEIAFDVAAGGATERVASAVELP
jgi:hypothetical protein